MQILLKIKHHIAVDTQGLAHAIDITTANVTDRDGACAMVINDKENLLVDGG